MMRVLHVHPNDEGTGGTQIASNLNTRLARKPGVESQLVVGNKTTDSDRVSEFPNLPGERYFNFAVERVLSLEGLGSPSSLLFNRILGSFRPDIIHLHVLHGRYFNILNLLRIPDDIPVVWTLHDMWPLTGNCVYSYGCSRFQDSCGSCPELDSSPKLLLDTTPLLLRLKDQVTGGLNLTAVAPSEWMASFVAGSHVNGVRVEQIPNGIDTNFYSERDPVTSRDSFGIDEKANVVLFVGGGNLNSRRKGTEFLIDALNRTADEKTYTLLALGSGEFPEQDLSDDINLVTPGFVDRSRLPHAYTAADVTVFPSLAESFGLVATESMACGTPVVASAVGGLQEQITEYTGWLVPPGGSTELAEALRAAFDDPDRRTEKGNNGRRRVETHYSLGQMVDRYVELYRSLLD